MAESIRMGLYLIGVVAAATLAGQLLRIRYSLARLLSVAMAAWMINCLTLAALLYLAMTGSDRPAWREYVLMLNAILLAGVPLLLYFWFLRDGEQTNG